MRSREGGEIDQLKRCQEGCEVRIERIDYYEFVGC
jgi:hypothetical protein